MHRCIIYFLKKKRLTLFALVTVIPLGMYCKVYRGPFEYWINHQLAGSFYEIFWILVVYLFLSDMLSINQIPVIVFGFTVTLEILQLWHPLFLELLRGTWLGKILLGTSFAWWDFPFYMAGCFIGWLWLREIQRRTI